MPELRESKRSQELKNSLAASFDLSPDVVSHALVALIGALNDRLPRGASVALLSWMPECWTYFSKKNDVPFPVAARGIASLKSRMVEAGVPAETALPFIRAFMQFVETRCGRPISDAMRRKIPELSAIQDMAPVTQPERSKAPVTTS